MIYTKKVIKNYNDENVSFGIASSHVILELPSTHSKHTSLVLAFHFVYLYKKGNAHKPQYSEQVRQTLFVRLGRLFTISNNSLYQM